MCREIREELQAEIAIDRHVTTVDYDYPSFHLHLACYMCHVVAGDLFLVEAEAARWLAKDELDTVDWLPADRVVVEIIKNAEA